MRLFSRGKKPESPQPLDEGQQEILDAIAGKLDKAEKCADAGEKFLMLQQIAAETDSLIWKAQKSVGARVTDLEGVSFLGVFVPGMGGALALATLLNPLLLLIAIPTVFAAAAVADRRGNNARTRFTDENRPFLAALETQNTAASDLTNALLSKDLHAIAESRYFPAILNGLPNNLRADFAAALSGELAAVKKPEADPKSLIGGFRL